MNRELPASPEKQRIDLSADYSASLQGEADPWFITFGAIKKKYLGQDIQYVVELDWDDIPEGKRGNVANSLKALKESAHALCTIRIRKEQKEALSQDLNSELSDCFNAFASGVKLEEID